MRSQTRYSISAIESELPVSGSDYGPQSFKTLVIYSAFKDYPYALLITFFVRISNGKCTKIDGWRCDIVASASYNY